MPIDDERKMFLKIFDSLTGSRNRWHIWRDMITMIACAISNTVDKQRFDERESLYMDAAKQYKPEELEKFAQLYGLLVLIMDRRMQENSWGDFFGELFMEMNLGSDIGGQFFTPYHVCLLCAQIGVDTGKISGDIERSGYAEIAEPAAGAGAMLIAAAEVMKDNGIDFQRDVLFSAQEIDATTAMMCYIQLSLLGCAGYVVIGNTLTEPSDADPLYGEESARCWKTPMFFADEWALRRFGRKHRKAFGTVPEAPEEDQRDSIKVTESDEGQIMFDLG